MADEVGRQRGRVARHLRFLRTRVRIRRIERRLMSNRVVELAYRTVREMSADDATHMAAGLAYYAVLSLFPLSVGLISLLGLLLEPEALEGEVFAFFETYLPVSKELLSANIAAAGNLHGFLGVISFFGLFWSASLMFGAITALGQPGLGYTPRPALLHRQGPEYRNGSQRRPAVPVISQHHGGAADAGGGGCTVGYSDDAS